MVSRSTGKREVLVEHLQKLGRPTTIKRVYAEFEKGVDGWAEMNAEALK